MVCFCSFPGTAHPCVSLFVSVVTCNHFISSNHADDTNHLRQTPYLFHWKQVVESSN